MTHLTVTRGLPASGKSTWAVEQVRRDPTGTINVCRDDLRNMLSSGFVAENERSVQKARDGLVDLYLKLGKNVIVSDTNLPQRVVRDLLKIADKHGAEFRVQDFTSVPLEECLRRNLNENRVSYGKSVPEEVIRDMYNRFLRGKTLPLPVPSREEVVVKTGEPYKARAGTPYAVLVDIDGTVAIRGERGPYDETRVGEDTPNYPIVDLVRSFRFDWGLHVVFVSARTDGCRGATEEWLRQNVTNGDDVLLHMRKSGDSRKDAVVKAEIFDEKIRDHFNVLYVLDDRDQVVEMWRSMGLTCLQVADGKF